MVDETLLFTASDVRNSLTLSVESNAGGIDTMWDLRHPYNLNFDMISGSVKINACVMLVKRFKSISPCLK